MNLWVNKYELAWCKKMQAEGRSYSIILSTIKNVDDDSEIEVEAKEAVG